MILPIFEIAFDCIDTFRVAAFWRAALDYVQEMPTPEELEAAYEAHPQWRDIAIVEDELLRHPRLYLQRVAEPKIGRNRITFELTMPGPRSKEIERLLALGATVLDDDWLADPEGNELQVLSGDGPRRFSAVVFDAVEPQRLAEFWGNTLGSSSVPGDATPNPNRRALRGVSSSSAAADWEFAFPAWGSRRTGPFMRSHRRSDSGRRASRRVGRTASTSIFFPPMSSPIARMCSVAGRRPSACPRRVTAGCSIRRATNCACTPTRCSTSHKSRVASVRSRAAFRGCRASADYGQCKLTLT